MRARTALLLLLLSSLSTAEDIVWVTTDFTSGSVAVQKAGECSARELAIVTPGDAVVRAWGPYVFVIGRLGYDHVTVLDAHQLDHVISQYSTGNGTNPQDLLPLEESRALVALFERAFLSVLDPVTGVVIQTVDLRPFADADGIPEAALLLRWGDRAYVVCERLDRTTPMMDPAGFGCLVVLDALTAEVIDADPSTSAPDPLWLPAANPTDVAQVGADLYLACAGSWSRYDDGALVHVDLRTGHARVVVKEQHLGGNAATVAVSGAKAFVGVSRPDWSNEIVPCNLASGACGVVLSGTSGGYIPELVVHDGLLYVADQGTWTDPARAGVLVFDAEREALRCGPVATGLPPMSAAVVSPVSAPIAPDPGVVRLWPNPASGLVTVRLPRWCPRARATLHDLTGRLVRALSVEEETTIYLTDDGRALARGPYLLRLRGEGLDVASRLIVE